MAEYLPILKPGRALTLKASATITAGQVVAISGSGTVAPAASASKAVVGVAGTDAATNDNIVVYAGGVQQCTAAGAITAGDPLIVGSVAGTVTTAASPAAATQIGIALTSAADTALVRVQFAR